MFCPCILYDDFEFILNYAPTPAIVPDVQLKSRFLANSKTCPLIANKSF